MRKLAFATCLAVQLIILSGCDFDPDDFSGDRFTEDFKGSYNLNAGGRLEIENFNGSIEILGWDKNTVEVNATKTAATQEQLSEIKIDVASTPDSVRIRSIRPEGRRSNMGVKYVITVPRKTILERVVSSNGGVRVQQVDGNMRIKTSNGTVRASTVKGDLDIVTSNGSVELSEFSGGAVVRTSNGSIRASGVRGFFEGHTSNGSMDIQVAAAESSRPIKLQSSNGKLNLTLESPKSPDVYASTSNSSITVRMPSSIAARVKASTSNSSISSDFELTQKFSESKNRLDGTIGSGGPLLDLSTSNGSIRLVRM